MQVPVTVIGGYLGAGKTTLLNHLLRRAGGQRIAVLVNDFGDVNIDAELIESRDGDVLRLQNGCICCTLAEGFTAAMYRLGEMTDSIDRVAVEASGVSDPQAVAQYAHLPGLRLDGVVVLADAAGVRSRSVDRLVGRTVLRQLAGADLVVLNKTDLVSPGELAALRTWIGEVAPQARVVEAVNADVPAALVLDAFDHAPVGEEALAEHGEEYTSWGVELAGTVSRAAVDAYLASLPPEVLRGKGVLALADEPSVRTVVHLVGARVAWSRGEPWGDAPVVSRLAFIGLAGAASDDARARFDAAFEGGQPLRDHGHSHHQLPDHPHHLEHR